jgi:hypothetical protein
MFNLIADSLETNDLLLGTLTPEEQNLKVALENEANQRRTAWSCKDDIQNGDELGIDCGGTYCNPCCYHQKISWTLIMIFQCFQIQLQIR